MVKQMIETVLNSRPPTLDFTARRSLTHRSDIDVELRNKIINDYLSLKFPSDVRVMKSQLLVGKPLAPLGHQFYSSHFAKFWEPHFEETPLAPVTQEEMSQSSELYPEFLDANTSWYKGIRVENF